MSHLFTPKNAEQKIFRLAIFQDGIWDIQIGGMIMLFSFYPITRRLLGLGWNLVLVFGLLGTLLFIGATLKRAVSNPRMGLVKFGRSQKSKLLTTRLIIFGIFLVTSALVTRKMPKIISRVVSNFDFWLLPNLTNPMRGLETARLSVAPMNSKVPSRPKTNTRFQPRPNNLRVMG